MAGTSNRSSGSSTGSPEKSSPAASPEPVVETTEKNPDTDPKETPKPKGKKSAETQIYHVRGPGSLMQTVIENGSRRTVTVPPGELVELTEKEAAEFGSLVGIGEPPPPPKAVGERTAGRYRVKGPGVVLYLRKERAAGEGLDLDEENARSLGDAVEEV